MTLVIPGLPKLNPGLKFWNTFGVTKVNQFHTILAAAPEKRNILMHHTTLTMSRANREIPQNNGLT